MPTVFSQEFPGQDLETVSGLTLSPVYCQHNHLNGYKHNHTWKPTGSVSTPFLAPGRKSSQGWPQTLFITWLHLFFFDCLRKCLFICKHISFSQPHHLEHLADCYKIHSVSYKWVFGYKMFLTFLSSPFPSFHPLLCSRTSSKHLWQRDDYVRILLLGLWLKRKRTINRQ